MTEHEEERARFIRARQRSPSSSMVGFAPNLSPRLSQVGVDALSVRVRGHWRSTLPTGRSLFDDALHLLDANWFNRPEREPTNRPTKITVKMSRARNTSTISECKFTAWELGSQTGNLEIALRLNPTRTLAHLIARIEHEGEGFLANPQQGVAEFMENLPPLEFFSRTPDGLVVPSLDRSDNYLPSQRVVRTHLGADFWSTFLPIYVQQVRRLCIALVSQVPNVVATEAMDRIVLENGSVILDWGQVRVPQIECYFERYHRTAVAAVRRGGWSILSADHSVELRRYSDAPATDHPEELRRYSDEPATFERDNDRFVIGLPLSAAYTLAIYAKLNDRIRFEVRRKTKGDYSALEPPRTPTMRLRDIIEQERQHLLAAVGWSVVGELLAGPDHPDLHDLLELIQQVSQAADNDAQALATILQSLLLDGSVGADSRHQPSIERLLRRGVLEPDSAVLERARIRRRDMNKRVVRYVLKAPYRDIHVLLADPLA